MFVAPLLDHFILYCIAK
uniref:Uncharacterized protein n=1 Tax=Arundo donax TaxID=35708 RepID=A0A0A8ZKR7_ARUDO